MQYALHNNLLSDVTLQSTRAIESMFVSFKRVKAHGKATNQHASGRCSVCVRMTPWVGRFCFGVSHVFLVTYVCSQTIRNRGGTSCR